MFYNAAFTFNKYGVIVWFYVFISSVIVVSVCAGGEGGGCLQCYLHLQ